MLRIFLFCFVFELTKLPSKPAGCISPNYPNADSQHPAQVGNTQVLGSAHTLATYSPRHCVDSEGNRCDLRQVRGTGPDAGRKNSNVKLGREGETEKSQFRHKNDSTFAKSRHQYGFRKPCLRLHQRRGGRADWWLFPGTTRHSQSPWARAGPFNPATT